VTGSATAAAHGLAIYFPPDQVYYKAEYDALPGTASWRAFLSALYGGGGSQAAPTFASGSLNATPSLLTLTGTVSSTTGLASAFLAYGLRAGAAPGSGAYLFGENEASISGSTVSGEWDWSFLRLRQGPSYFEFGYLALRTLSATQGVAVIPLVYDTGTQRDAMRLIVFDQGTGAIQSDKVYLYASGGTLGELTPAAGSKLRAKVGYLADERAWSQQWILFDGQAAGFDATAPVTFDFPALNSGAGYFAGLRIQNAAQAGDWLYTNPATVKP